MANENRTEKDSIDSRNGFCSKNKIFHSLRPQLPLPPPSAAISVTQFALSLLRNFPPPPNTTALIDAVTYRYISFNEFILSVKSLSSSLHHRLRLKKGDVVFILSPNSLDIPILCFALFSIGVIVSTGNPASSKSEILHQFRLSKPVLAFATSDSAHKISNIRTFIIDSPEFDSLMESSNQGTTEFEFEGDEVLQSDPAAILYSSGTTGRVKGVVLTHRNFTAIVAAGNSIRTVRKTPPVNFCAVPFFHVYGLSYFSRAVALGETTVSMRRFDMKTMLRAIQEFRITHMALAPPIVVAMVKDHGILDSYDLSSLEVIGCGGAPVRKSVVELFRQRFPNVILGQAYGLTETTARVFGTVGPKEGQVIGATGKLMPNCQAKIVDPDTGISLPPGSTGELWLRGPTVMKGYVGDEEATAKTLDSDGWLRTGDLCYIDNEGFLFFVDRIKELIKYKGYQVAPAELEQLLQSHPDIVEAAVIPYPDEEAGQVPVAFVVRQRGSTIGEAQIKDFIAQQVAPYKKIRKVIFVDSIPKNASGKILRRELIKLALTSSSSKL